jgi:hypothetical protein
MSTCSDTPSSSSEGDDQYSAQGNSWSPPSLADPGVLHDPVANTPPSQGFAHPFDLNAAPQVNQDPFGQFPAANGPPVVASHAVEPAHGFGYVGGLQLTARDRCNHPPEENPRSQAQGRLVFAPLNQEAMRPAISPNGLMCVSPCCRYGQGLAAPSLTPIQSTNHGGMYAGVINNNYHVHGPAKSPQRTGNSLETQPLLPMYRPTDVTYTLNYPQTSMVSQRVVGSVAPAYAPSGGNLYHNYYRQGPENDATYGTRQYPVVSACYGGMGYGTSMKVPCTSMSSGLMPVAPCLHSVFEADVFKNRSLDKLPTREQVQDKFPDETTMPPSGPPNASNYRDKQANGYRISIPGLTNFISPNSSNSLPRHSSHLVDNHEKGIATTINQRSPPAIYRVRRIALSIICCLAALLLLSGGVVGVLHPEWQFSRFAFIV